MSWLSPITAPLEKRREERRRQWRESQQRVRGKRPPLPASYLRLQRLKNLGLA